MGMPARVSHGRIRSAWPAFPTRDDPQRAIEILLERGYDACEIDFEGGFWMDYPWAEQLGEAARAADVALSVHAPLFGFMGHLEASGRKFSSAVGALDRSAGIATAVRRRGRRLPPRLPARPRPRGRYLLGRRPARRRCASGSRARSGPCRSASR